MSAPSDAIKKNSAMRRVMVG